MKTVTSETLPQRAGRVKKETGVETDTKGLCVYGFCREHGTIRPVVWPNDDPFAFGFARHNGEEIPAESDLGRQLLEQALVRPWLNRD